VQTQGLTGNRRSHYTISPVVLWNFCSISNPIILLNYMVSTVQSEQSWYGFKQTETYRFIQKLADDWPGSTCTQTKVSFKSIFSKVNFQFSFEGGSAVPNKTDPIRLEVPIRKKSTHWGRLPRKCISTVG